MNKLISFVLMVIIGTSPVLSQNKEYDYSDKYIPRKYISDLSKPTLVMLTATWCGPCKYMKENIMKLPEVRLYKQTESAWKKAERWHKKEYYEYVVEDCDNLLPYMKHDYRFLFAYGQSLNKTGNYEKSDAILRMGTEISSDPMFWNVMGNNSLALGRYREAEGRYKHAFYMVPNRLYPLNLLAKLYHAEGDTVRFLDMADNVELFVPKVESVNTERLRSEIRELKSCYISSFDK
ncbi:MAG TPA: hypothetical protein DCW98_06255 [Bacteroidales bacterium]|nr:hypothetical protein [Bacteroidales bacterium]